MADAVEKVRGILPTRNNRVIGAGFLNRTCAFEAHFESEPPKKSFFDSIGPSCHHEQHGKLSGGKLPSAAIVDGSRR